jgi:hypothetical protein
VPAVAEAAISGEKFYGDILIILGSVFVLWTFLTSFLNKAWRRRIGVVAAIFLGVGAALSEGSELKSYTNKHSIAAWLSLLVLFLIGACLFSVVGPPTFKRAKRKISQIKGKQAGRCNLHKGCAEPRKTGAHEPKPDDDDPCEDEIVTLAPAPHFNGVTDVQQARPRIDGT